MKKRTVILAGILTMLAIITSIGITAMLQKPIGETPHKIITEEDMKALEQEIQELEGPVVEEPMVVEEEDIELQKFKRPPVTEELDIMIEKPIQKAPPFRSKYQ